MPHLVYDDVKGDINTSNCSVLPRDAMHKRGLCRRPVSVCLPQTPCYATGGPQHKLLRVF